MAAVEAGWRVFFFFSGGTELGASQAERPDITAVFITHIPVILSGVTVQEGLVLFKSNI